MKIVQKPFWLYGLTDQPINKIEEDLLETDPDCNRRFAKKIRNEKSTSLLAVNPSEKNAALLLTAVREGKIIAGVFHEPALMFLQQAVLCLEGSKRMIEQSDIQFKSEFIDIVDQTSFNRYLQLHLSAIILLHTALEAFINSVIPERLLEFDDRSWTKEDIERQFKYKQKLQLLSDSCAEMNFNIKISEDKKLYDDLLTLNNIRNNLIHLKSAKKQNNFSRSINDIEDASKVDLDKILKASIRFMNQLKPSFVEVEEQ